MPASGTAGVIDQTFDFESIGNLKGRKLSAPAASPARNEAETFSYDALDRLIGASGVSDGDNGSFAYDGGAAGGGNLSNKETSGSGSI